MTIIVTTHPNKPNRYKCEIRGREVVLNRREAQQLSDYLAHALAHTDVPVVRGIKAYQQEQRRSA